MEFVQKRMATQTWFTFDERELNHRVRDNSGEQEFSVEYGAIPPSKRAVFNRNNWLRNVGLIWCVIGVIQLGLALTSGGGLTGSGFWLMIGLGCLAFYRLTWSEFTLLDTPEGSIWIIRDKQHEEILKTITEKRKSQLLAWYHGLDFSDAPEREVQTVEWLMKQEVLSKSDGEARIAGVRSGNALTFQTPEDEAGPKIH